MASKSFQIDTYEVKLSREMTLGGGGIQFYSYISCKGDGCTLLIYFLTPESANMDNHFLPDRNLGRIVLPWDQFPVYIDMLRNEKPLYAYMNSTKPISNRIFTGQEPIGEEES